MLNVIMNTVIIIVSLASGVEQNGMSGFKPNHGNPAMMSEFEHWLKQHGGTGLFVKTKPAESSRLGGPNPLEKSESFCFVRYKFEPPSRYVSTQEAKYVLAYRRELGGQLVAGGASASAR